MVLLKGNSPMEHIIWAMLTMESEKEKVFSTALMETNILGNGKTIHTMEMGHILWQLEKFIKEDSKMVAKMAKENPILKMEICLKAHTLKMFGAATVSTNIFQQGSSMKDNGQTTCEMGLEFSYMPMEIDTKETG